MPTRPFASFAVDFGEMAAKISTSINRTIPVKVKNEALEHFDTSWEKQAFAGGGSTWPPRKAPPQFGKKGTELKTFKKWTAWNTGRAVLIGAGGQGGLRGSMAGRVTNGGRTVVISNSKPYAQVHNEGGMAGRGLKTKIPPRPFMGQSPILSELIERIVDTEFKKASNP